MASQPLYQLYLELEDYEPKIWRRIQVMNNIKFSRLGYIIMTLFEMQASHLYEFEIDRLENFKRWDKKFFEDFSESKIDLKKVRCGIPDEDNIYDFNNLEGYEPLKDSTEEYVKHYIYHENDEMLFKYDFGDNWIIKVKLEKIFEDKETDGKEFPRVIEGQGYGIIENCGGTGGLEEIRQAFITKKGVEYANYSEWLGTEKLDLDTFDINDMNFRLKKVPRIYADCYEYEIEPTKQSMKILNREYLKDKKKVTERDPEKIKRDGIKALKDKLGVEGMIKFIQIISNGTGDYTKEKNENPEEFTIEDFEKYMKENN